MSTGSIEPSPSPSPGSAGSQSSAVTIPNGAPKFGTLVPNRVFVGGISSNTTESELHQLFSAFGNVKQTKIIADRAGVSKGYGFVTFETEEEARRLQQAEADNIMLKERKLNIAPAIKKQQPFGRQYEMGQPLVNGALYYHNGVPYTYQNGMAMFTAGPDGQPCQVGAALVPSTNTATPTTPFPLLYSGGTIPSPAVYLPTPSLGSATAAAQAAASLTQQQFQFQTAINNAAAAQQNQSPSSGGSTPGSGVPTPAAAAGWRWITPQSSTASSCHGQQSAAVAAATGPGHANPAQPQLTTQTFNYTQASSPTPLMLTGAGVSAPVQCINPTPAPQQHHKISTKSSSQPTSHPNGAVIEQNAEPVVLSNNTTPGYQPSTPGYQPLSPGYQPSTPGYQPSTPGYHPSTHGYIANMPGYQPLTPGYQPHTPGYHPPTSGYQPGTPGHQPGTHGYQIATPGYQAATPGYHPLITQRGTFICDPKMASTEDPEKTSTCSSPSRRHSFTEPPSRRLSFTATFKKGLERGVRKEACRGGCFVCPSEPPQPSSDGDTSKEDPSTFRAPPTKTEEVASIPSNQTLEEGDSAVEGWSGVEVARQFVYPGPGYCNYPGSDTTTARIPGLGYYSGPDTTTGRIPGLGYYPGPETTSGRIPGPGYYPGPDTTTGRIPGLGYYPGPGYYNNVPLAPLTPITPSVDPAAGFKTGYIEPQTPNPMTPNQFYYYFQASPMYSHMDASSGAHYPPLQGQHIQSHQGQPIQSIKVHPIQEIPGKMHVAADTVELAQPPPGKSANDNFQTTEASQGGAFTFIKPAAKKNRSYMENNNGSYNRHNAAVAAYNNNTSYFTSPFKTFTKFQGTPSPTRYPLRSPNYRPPKNNVNRRAKTKNLSLTNSHDKEIEKDKVAAETGSDTKDTKANWYKAGERFGVSSTFQKRNKSVNDPAPNGSTTSGSSSLTPPPTPLSLAEPDLIAGQMRNISLK